MSHRILLVNRNIFELEKALLVLNNEYEVITANNGEMAFKLIKQENIEIIFTEVDIIMSDGKELLVKVKEDFPNIIE
jgi:response regulator RpfG family c-di-GMP phosphodiesterase